MATMLAADNSGGLVIKILMQQGYRVPELKETCTASDIANDIPAFAAGGLSKERRKEVIRHAKQCRPCSNELGWGDL